VLFGCNNYSFFVEKVESDIYIYKQGRTNNKPITNGIQRSKVEAETARKTTGAAFLGCVAVLKLSAFTFHFCTG